MQVNDDFSIDFPTVRRLEAVGFRAWPADTSTYDGSWLIRLTPGRRSKRLNSINPLDPSDWRDIGLRLDKAGQRFRELDLPLIVRQTPLCPPQLIAYLDERWFERFSETIVMTLDIPPNEPSEAVEHLPFSDIGRFVDARLAITGEDPATKQALAGIIAAIKPETGMFLFESATHGPTAVSLAVHDMDLAGLLQVAVAPQSRRQGVGSAIVNASLRWARLRGATKAWLAVEAANSGAIALYRSFGFTDAYRYVYRRQASGVTS